MPDVMTLMNAYRECARSLWNVYFRQVLPCREQWELQDEYEDVCNQLFSTLVLSPIGRDSERKAARYAGLPQPLAFLRVIPTAADGVPVMINRDLKPSGYWDHPVERLKPSEADLRFIDFFDFDRLGIRDLAYYRARIVASEQYPDIVGRDALVSWAYAAIEVVDDAPSTIKARDGSATR